MRVVCNWLIAVVLVVGARATAANPRNIDLGPDMDEVVTLAQNWSDDESNWFYNVSQGSRLVPYDWFLHLEQADSQTRFADNGHIRSLGYIPRTKDDSDDKDGLPIGFVRDAKFGDDLGGVDALGLTCAACHTSLIVSGRKGYLVDGGPGMGDLEELLKRLARSLEATAADDAKFDRFAAKVLPAGSPTAAKAKLRDNVRDFAKLRAGYNDRNLPKNAPGRFGHGRVDAFGAIFNEVAATFLETPGNVHVANAPVSYPCLWDTPQHDVVQWNGAAENKTNLLGKLLFGTEHVGALGRNAGEVLGVFGFADIPRSEILPRPYLSTTHKSNLIRIEDSLRSLWSPEWPFGPLDGAAVGRGKAIFAQNCAKCHESIDRTNPARKVEAKMADVGTDQQMIVNFMQSGSTGRLRGRQETLLDLTKRLGPTEPIPLILKHVVERVILNQALPSADLVRQIAEEKLKPEAKVSVNALNPGYRMVATIAVGDKKLTGEFDSIVREGNRLRVKGGDFFVLERNFDVATSGVESLRSFDLTTTDGIRSAAGRLAGALSSEAGDGDSDAVIANAVAQFNYKARPLNGVWATAPYLHNGSVRTLAELLEPVAKRAKKLHVGSRTFDPVGVGFVDDPAMPELDTAGIGNGNGGHEYGAGLADHEKKDLLEYLKSL